MPDGSEYNGGWANDFREGSGELIAPAGCSYTGNWVKGQRHGHGRAVMRKGGGASEEKVYEGGWAHDEFHGHGVLTCADNRKYDGQWKQGKRHGYGIYQFKNGSRYEGNWHNDHRSGMGTLLLPGISEYEGTWSNGSYIEGTTWRRQHQQAPRERVGELHRSAGWSGEAPMIPMTFRNQSQPPNVQENVDGYGGYRTGPIHARQPIMYRASNPEQHVLAHSSRTDSASRTGSGSSSRHHDARAIADFAMDDERSDTRRSRGRNTDWEKEDGQRVDPQHATFDPTRASG